MKKYVQAITTATKVYIVQETYSVKTNQLEQRMEPTSKDLSHVMQAAPFLYLKTSQKSVVFFSVNLPVDLPPVFVLKLFILRVCAMFPFS